MTASLEQPSAEPAHQRIRKYFQHQIQIGALKPGDRLPSTEVLADQWRMSCTGVQSALASLTAAGWVERTPRRGTFVSRTEREGVIGILLGPSLTDESAHYYRALLQAIEGEVSVNRKKRRWICRTYDGLTAAENREATKRQFLRDLENYPFKGVIEIAGGLEWRDALTVGSKLPVADNSEDVTLDLSHFYRESFKFASTRNRPRMAMLQVVGPYGATDTSVYTAMEAARDLGLERPEILTFAVKGTSRQRGKMIHEQAVSIFRQWRDSEGHYTGPGTLVAGDDIAMRSVALALLQEGIQVPDELLVICESTEASRLYYGFPVTHYEFSVRETAAKLLETVWQRIMKTPPEECSLIQGRLLEDE